MLEDSLLTTLAMDEAMKSVIMVAIGAGVLFFWFLFKNVAKMNRDKEREQTKRELAAYVAEGSISPEDAVKLANAGGGGEFEEQIKAKLAAGSISPKKAEEMLRAAYSAAKQEYNKA